MIIQCVKRLPRKVYGRLFQNDILKKGWQIDFFNEEVLHLPNELKRDYGATCEQVEWDGKRVQCHWSKIASWGQGDGAFYELAK